MFRYYITLSHELPKKLLESEQDGKVGKVANIGTTPQEHIHTTSLSLQLLIPKEQKLVAKEQ
jgi:hypothetical protein